MGNRKSGTAFQLEALHQEYQKIYAAAKIMKKRKKENVRYKNK